MIKICKFGGSSVADAEQFKKVKNIVNSDHDRRVVVVSAIGKTNSNDNKVTDLLFLIASHIKYKVDYSSLFEEVKSKYVDIKKELGLEIDLDREFENIQECIAKKCGEAYLVSRGEYLSAKLMAAYLGFKFVDAKDLFVFDYSGKIDTPKTEEAIKSHISPTDKVVIPGFYGTNPNNAFVLFSRGGSDVSAALIARALRADVYENFTDVSGILKADPKIIDNPSKIKVINYEELRELSYMGAKVIHEDTLLPLEDLEIPIHILNTNKPEDEGTIILKNAKDNEGIITGITGKKDYYSLTIVKRREASKLAVISEVLDILKRHDVSLEHLPTSIDTISLIISSNIGDKIYQIIGEIKELDKIIDVSLDSDLALIAIVGRGMATKPGISGKIFGVLGKANINIKAIAQGSKELTIIIGVSNSDMVKTIKELYYNL